MIIKAVKDVPFTPKRDADSTTALIFFTRQAAMIRLHAGSTDRIDC